MYLHKNKELFRNVILVTSQKLEVSEDIVEKDYNETTTKLISDSLEYDKVKKHYRILVEKIFEYI